MKVKELGEFGLIELLAEVMGRAGVDGAGKVLVGIGDDAAAWPGEGRIQLATTDTLVENVHFTLETASWRDLGWKALAVNLSDIAAMGGLPEQALISLSLPGDTEVESITHLYEGMAEIAHRFQVAIVGGDITAAPLVVIGLSVTGSAQGEILTRSAALPGEVVAVTGYLGSSAAGLRMLQRGLKLHQETASFLTEAHLRPCPRVEEGQRLARSGVKAAIDLSDGLLADLTRLCQASGVGARIRASEVPIHPLVKAAFPEDSLHFALSGGEDYELLFTGDRDLIKGINLPCPITILGEITTEEPGRVILLDEKGDPIPWREGGWEHFAREGP